MILLEDEKLVLQWLSDYGPLTKQQLLWLLCYKSGSTAEVIIRNLRRNRLIKKLDSGFYALDSMSVPDPDMNLAVWVLLKFIEKIKPMDHRPAEYPAQIFFVKEKQAYEIVVIPGGEEYRAQMLPKRQGIKYIFVVSDLANVPKIVCPAAPCLFAEASFMGPNQPDIRFYSREETENGEM